VAELRREIIIVGSGPAGAATALGIVARSPALAAGTTLLERAVHPRDKTCAGGVIPKAVRELRALGLDVALKKHAEGYLLDPGVEIAVVS
jgi:2-polyprenyl-6-methoxyphenol hydroxylase-like FAD-dependent oxidoreductase